MFQVWQRCGVVQCNGGNRIEEGEERKQEEKEKEEAV